MAELCNLLHRFASTSTAIVVTVRLFARSFAPHGEYKTLQIPGTNNQLWCITTGFGLEMRPSVPNKRLVNVNLPFFKAAIGPTSACMVLKNGL